MERGVVGNPLELSAGERYQYSRSYSPRSCVMSRIVLRGNQYNILEIYTTTATI